MSFRAWKFFFFALVTTFFVIDWIVLGQSLDGLVNKSEYLMPLVLVIGITLVCRAIFTQAPPLWLKIVLSLGASFLNLRYLHWRVTETLVLDWYNAPISLALFMMEFIAIVNVTLLNYQTLILTNHSSEADKGQERIRQGLYTPSVDVLIPTYNEPNFVLRRTVVGAQAMHYPNKEVWLLDDSRRPHVKQLAEELGCKYTTRNESSHAKAGNLNNGLKYAKGDIVVVFDADFIPLENFLERTVGFFENPEVALVVTPQNFYNPDQPEINLGGRIIPHEQTVFYGIIQPGRDYTNSVVCTGTSSLMRRKHLDEVGGIAIGVIVEDWATGMSLQAKGYKSLFLNEMVSVGAAPENFSSYLVQRVRWAEGTIKILYTKFSPLRIPGLNLIQKINHMSSVIFWIDQATQSISYVAPALFFLLGMRSMDTSLLEIIYYWVPNYFFGLFLVSWVIGSRTILVTYSYNALMCFYLFPTVISTLLFPNRKVKFKVTDKGLSNKQTTLNFKLMRPIIILLVVNLIAVGVSVFKAHSSDFFIGAEVINLLWAQFIAIVLAISVIAGIDLVEERESLRVKCSEPCKIHLDDSETDYFSTLVDISETGVAFWKPENLSVTLGQTLEFSIPGEQIQLRAEVKRVGESIGCQFLNVTTEQQRKLIEFAFCRVSHWQKPKVADEMQALIALFRSLFDLYPLKALR
ncbi:MAG: glycosyltransferase [Coleofasciculaceae cyanobacterium]